MSAVAGSSSCSRARSSKSSASSGALWILHVALLLIALWLCSSFRPAVAIRIHPPGSSHGVGNRDQTISAFVGRRPVPFGNASPAPPDTSGFEDSKRRVPSCPDPLHNRMSTYCEGEVKEEHRKALY